MWNQFGICCRDLVKRQQPSLNVTKTSYELLIPELIFNKEDDERTVGRLDGKLLHFRLPKRDENINCGLFTNRCAQHNKL
jgi:hypothetical protein